MNTCDDKDTSESQISFTDIKVKRSDNMAL